MSRIDDLITTMCPDGVEFKKIGEIGMLVRGNGMPKSDFSETGVGCIHYGQIYTHYGAWTTETIARVPVDTAARLTKVDPGDLIVTNTSENLDDVCKAVAWLGGEQIVTGGHATVLKHSLDPKYLAYYLQTRQFHTDKKRHATGTKVIDVSAKSLAKISIPVPPLMIQQEIAVILDRFTKLETDLKVELKAELEERRQQYRFYLDRFLGIPDGEDGQSDSAGPQIMTLGELGEFIRGSGIQKSDFCDTGVGCIHYGQIHTHYGTWAERTKSCVSTQHASKLRKAKKGDLVIATTSEDDQAVGKAVAWLGEEEVAVSTDAYIYRHCLDPKYAAFFFQSEQFQSEKRRHVTGAKVRRISGHGMAQIRIPVPSIDEQKHIANLLDKFEALLNDLSSGLPAEIAARRQQYKHYRDRLLTFQEAA